MEEKKVRARLTQIKRDADLEGGLRTKAVEGNLMYTPELDVSVVLITESLEPVNGEEGFRYVKTSRIVKIEEKEDHELITTKSGSTYKLERI